MTLGWRRRILRITSLPSKPPRASLHSRRYLQAIEAVGACAGSAIFVRNIVVAADRKTAIRDVGAAIAESYRVFGDWGLFTGVVGDVKTHPESKTLLQIDS